jgi:hypothetical protein
MPLLLVHKENDMTKLYLTKRDKRERFESRFAYNPETGVRQLTAAGCNEKYDMPREEIYLTASENKQRNWENWNRSEAEERRLIIRAHAYFQQGLKLRPDESLEHFVNRCAEDMGEEVLYGRV